MSASVNNCGVNLVIDSGSTVTAISSRTYDKINFSNKPPLSQTSEQVLLADGKAMPISGMCT